MHPPRRGSTSGSSREWFRAPVTPATGATPYEESSRRRRSPFDPDPWIGRRRAPDARPLRLRPVHRTVLTIITGLLCGALLVGNRDFSWSACRAATSISSESASRSSRTRSPRPTSHSGKGRMSFAWRLQRPTRRSERSSSASASTSSDKRRAHGRIQRRHAEPPRREGAPQPIRRRSPPADAGVLHFLNAPPTDPAAFDSIAAQLTRANRGLLLPLEQIRALYVSRAGRAAEGHGSRNRHAGHGTS